MKPLALIPLLVLVACSDDAAPAPAETFDFVAANEGEAHDKALSASGALLGTLVGTVIVAQTLYSSTKDHLNEFATLRALGSSSGYIHKVILAQAVMSAVLGYVLGMSIAMSVVAVSIDTSFPIIMTPQLALGLFALTLIMCVASATGAIMKVMKLDPAMVFNR